MKGFPNQISSIAKITQALRIVSEAIDSEGQHDDDSIGELLLRNGVINPSPGHSGVDSYLELSRQKNPSNQSHRTAARGLKEILHLADLVEMQNSELRLTASGHRLLEAFASDGSSGLTAEWKSVARNIQAFDSQGSVSHPYRVLLRMLVARPGTPRSLCALALEAKNDSEEELNRIIGLRDMSDEGEIRNTIGISKSNWDNAKKILPSIAEQVGDVARGQKGLYVVEIGLNEDSAGYSGPTSYAGNTRSNSKLVTASTIATTKTPIDSDEATSVAETDLVSLADAIAKRADRSYRHNILVQKFTGRLKDQSMEIWEGVFDCLAVGQSVGILAEIKTLDGSHSDEIHQVRLAAAQLLYYERFDAPLLMSTVNKSLFKVAVFEQAPNQAHAEWLEGLDICCVWMSNDAFSTTDGARVMLSSHLWLSAG